MNCAGEKGARCVSQPPKRVERRSDGSVPLRMTALSLSAALFVGANRRVKQVHARMAGAVGSDSTEHNLVVNPHQQTHRVYTQPPTIHQFLPSWHLQQYLGRPVANKPSRSASNPTLASCGLETYGLAGQGEAYSGAELQHHSSKSPRRRYQNREQLSSFPLLQCWY